MGKKFRKTLNVLQKKNVYNKTPKINPELKTLDSLKAPKTDGELKIQIDNIKNKSLKQRLLTSKIVWVGGAFTGLSVFYVNNYKNGNTGCFLESKDNTCKIKELSCCNPNESVYIEKCSDEILNRLNIDKLACNNYDLNDPLCCRQCDCQYHSCEKDEKMICHKATTAEAISFFAENMSSTVSDTFHKIITSSIVLKIISIGFFTLVLGLIIYKMI